MADDIGSQLLVYLIVYAIATICLLLFFGALGRYMGKRALGKKSDSLADIKTTETQQAKKSYETVLHGAFASANWPPFLRGPVSMLVILFGFMPCAVIAICFTFGLLMAAIEGWSAKEGILYVLTSALGLLHSLESVSSPDNAFGKLADALISCWVMLMAATAMGIVAGLSLVVEMTDSMPSSPGAFLRYVFVYVPLVIFATSFLAGCLLSAVEGWSVDDGFYYMMSSVCGLDEPLVDMFPETAFGTFLEVLFICVELGFAGAIIGIVGGHPLMQTLLVKIEGDEVNLKFEHMLEEVNAMLETHEMKGESLSKSLTFAKVMRENGFLPAEPSAEELNEAFKRFDENGDGTLCAPEIKAATASLGYPEAETENILALLDADKDGKVSLQEFQLHFASKSKGKSSGDESASIKVTPVCPNEDMRTLPGIPQKD